MNIESFLNRVNLFTKQSEMSFNVPKNISTKSGCEVLIWYKNGREMLSSFLVNLREYCCSLVQCCQQVSHFTGTPRAHSLSTNYYIKSLLSHHVGLAGFATHI